MKTLIAIVCAALMAPPSLPAPSAGDPYPVAWYFQRANLAKAGDAAAAISRVREAAGLGLSGVVLQDAKFATIGLYNYDDPANEWRQNADAFADACRETASTCGLACRGSIALIRNCSPTIRTWPPATRCGGSNSRLSAGASPT